MKHDKTRQDKTRQDKARQERTIQNKQVYRWMKNLGGKGSRFGIF